MDALNKAHPCMAGIKNNKLTEIEGLSLVSEEKQGIFTGIAYDSLEKGELSFPIKQCKKFYHRDIVNILRIKF